MVSPLPSTLFLQLGDLMSIVSLISPKHENRKSIVVSSINELILNGTLDIQSVLRTLPTIEEVILSSFSQNSLRKPIMEDVQNMIDNYLDLDKEFLSQKLPCINIRQFGYTFNWTEDPIIGHVLYFFLNFIGDKWLSYIATYEYDFFFNKFVRMVLLSIHQTGCKR